jgi:RNA polymerase sigma-70 factor (ECF subfamily)
LRELEGSPSDADLVRRALTGERWAEAAIYHRHARYVGNLAARLLENRDDAMDVLQDVFVEAMSTLETLRDPAALKAWLGTMTVRRAHRRFRRRKLLRRLALDRQPDDAPLHSLASATISPEEHAELARAGEALGTVPARARFAWLLHEVEGETLPSVAATLGTSLATVKRDVALTGAVVRRAVGASRTP